MTLAPDVDAFEHARNMMRQLMQERGTTQMDLVPVLGVVQVAVSARVIGRTKLTLADIYRLARYWDVDPRVFFPNGVSESAWTRTGARQRHLHVVAA